MTLVVKSIKFLLLEIHHHLRIELCPLPLVPPTYLHQGKRELGEVVEFLKLDLLYLALVDAVNDTHHAKPIAINHGLPMDVMLLKLRHSLQPELRPYL